MKLPNTVSSLQDLGILSLEIREYAKWFSHNAIKERVHARGATPPPPLSPGALEMIRTISSKKLLSQQMLDDLLREIETAKKNAPTITITLAAPAANDLKQTLVGACREHIADNALVTFKFSSGLLGGMVVAYGSRVFDWSFRRQILANGSKFPEVLRHVQ